MLAPAVLASSNLRFANAASVPDFCAEGGCGTRATRSRNGLGPALLDRDTLLLLPRRSVLIVLCTDNREPVSINTFEV